MDKDYININKNLWNKRTELHVGSAFYNNASFIEGRNSLNSIEIEMLGDVKGLHILHLQCHFGQDSISLSRMGARVTGVDFSDVAITKAKELAAACDTDTEFVLSDIYELKTVLDKSFDIVFTSYGTIGWLPDINSWAEIVSYFIKPNGRFVFAEFHPIVWMFDDNFSKVQYNYFKDIPIIENEEGTYADKQAKLREKCITWNHSLSSVYNALQNAGVIIRQFKEYDYSPYNCFNDTVEISPGRYQIKQFGNKLPMVYSLSGVKETP